MIMAAVSPSPMSPQPKSAGLPGMICRVMNQNATAETRPDTMTPL
jgi:hypothetical protein